MGFTPDFRLNTISYAFATATCLQLLATPTLAANHEAALEAHRAKVQFRLCIGVRDEAEAGSDSDLFVKLHGQNGAILEKWRLDNPGVADTKRGEVSCFSFMASDPGRQDYGPINKIELSMHPTNDLNDICYDWVTVERRVLEAGSSVRLTTFFGSATVEGVKQLIQTNFDFAQCLGDYGDRLRNSGVIPATNPYTPPPPVDDTSSAPTVDISGRWVQKCPSGRACSMTTEKEYTFGKAFTSGYTKAVETAIETNVTNSTTVKAEVDSGVVTASAENTFSMSLTAGLTNAVSRAKETSEQSSEGLKQIFKCPVEVPVGKLGYLWESNVAVGNHNATVLHCLDACSANYPSWDPGQNITSCNTTVAEDEAAAKN